MMNILKNMDYLIRISESAIKTQKMMDPIIKNYNAVIQSNRQYFETIKRIQDSISPFIKIAEEYRFSSSLKVFPKEGWYFSYEIIENLNEYGYLLETAESWGENNIKAVFEKKILAYLQENISIIEKRIINISEKREKIIKEIFALHKEKRYAASIPLALAQIDGICNEAFGIGFFSSTPYNKENKKPGEQKLKLKLGQCSLSMLLYRQVSYDDKNELILIKSNNTEMSELNRHCIMHGESVDYASEINAAKTILLLDFVRSLIENIFKN